MNENPEDLNYELTKCKSPLKFDMISQKHRSFPDLRILTSSHSTSSDRSLSQTEKNEVLSSSKYPKLGRD
jgi:hypothetical protein